MVFRDSSEQLHFKVPVALMKTHVCCNALVIFNTFYHVKQAFKFCTNPTPYFEGDFLYVTHAMGPSQDGISRAHLKFSTNM